MTPFKTGSGPILVSFHLEWFSTFMMMGARVYSSVHQTKRTGIRYKYLEPKWPLFWLEKTLFWRGQGKT